MKPRDLPVSIVIFETTRMQDELAESPEGSIGSFSFRDALPPDGKFGGDDPHLSGWFVLNAQSFEDAWVQVLHGGYSECSLELWIGPVDDTGPGLLWDVKKNPHLTIDTLTLSFSRPAPALRPLAGPSRAAFDLKGQKTMSLGSLSWWQRIKRRWATSAYKHSDGTIELDFEIAAGIDPFVDSEAIKRAKLQRYYARQHFWRKVSGTAVVSAGVFLLGKHIDGSIGEAISRMSLYGALSIGVPIALGLWMIFDDNI